MRVFRIHLGPAVLPVAEAGKHNFLNRLTAVLRDCGYQCEYWPNGFAERIATGSLPGWSMFEMEPPEGSQSLVFRRAYVAPFWQVDRTDKRWDWDVARAAFQITTQQRALAEEFAAAWRRRLYEGRTATATSNGSLFVPLQSRLLEQRPFQSLSPIAMLEALLQRYPGRPIHATLHPKVTYSQAETDALAALAVRHPALTISRQPAETLLATCDLVATQNSAVAFEALFWRKPVILFAGIDFHHALASVWRDGMETAFDQLESGRPDFDGYLWWYLQRQSLNAGREDFRVRSMVRLGDLGVDLLVE
ncbi:MAG: hypothetical protein ORN49_02195 [Rhodobacteraceae bacterium]|nr:hypothetical protein [Paracoccaceae bacterium]